MSRNKKGKHSGVTKQALQKSSAKDLQKPKQKPKKKQMGGSSGKAAALKTVEVPIHHEPKHVLFTNDKLYCCIGFGTLTVYEGSVCIMGYIVTVGAGEPPIQHKVASFTPDLAVPLRILSDGAKLHYSQEMDDASKVAINHMSVTQPRSVYANAQGSLAGIQVGRDDIPVVCITPEYEQAAAHVLAAEGSTVMVCGNADVGKSTFCRYLLNVALNCKRKVYFVECDVGQTEFTVPGCVSLVEVTDPVLGPSFSHVCEPALSVYIGAPTPSKNPNGYVQAVKEVKAQLDQLMAADRSDNPPIVIINTMGWLKDLGLCLLADVMHITEPSTVIHITNEDAVDSDKLDPRNMGLQTGYKDGPQAVTYNLGLLVSAKFSRPKVATGPKNSLSNKNLRQAVCLAYYGRICPQGLLQPLLSFTPYPVKFSDVAIACTRTKVSHDVLPEVVNGREVALCVIPQRNVLTHREGPHSVQYGTCLKCVGFGIVRCFDAEQRTFYLITPVPETVVRSVNCWVSGVSDFPMTRLHDFFDDKESFPYYTSGKHSSDMAAITPRSFLNRGGPNNGK